MMNGTSLDITEKKLFVAHTLQVIYEPRLQAFYAKYQNASERSYYNIPIIY